MVEQEKDIRLIRFENTAAALREASKCYLLVRGRSVLRASIDHYEKAEAGQEGGEQAPDIKRYPLY